jgi:uncharacterized protein YecE (DUF72 family)
MRVAYLTEKILIGTASWSDPGFVERWYPKGMRPVDRLGWYAEHFELVEVNSTFYSVPDPRMVERWCATTPEKFTFDVKLHQLLSRHSTIAKFLPPALRERGGNPNQKVALSPALEEGMIRAFLPSLQILRDEKKLGALLLQLSPAFSPRKHQLSELDQLLSALREYQVAIEFRNRNWVEGKQFNATRAFLEKYKTVFVNVDAPAVEHFTVMPGEMNEVTSSDLAYLRLHGRDASAYLKGKTVAARFNYDYNDNEISEIADRCEELARRTRALHVIFNNNCLDYAPRAGIRLRKAIGQLKNI